MFSSVSIEIPKYLGSSLEGVECPNSPGAQHRTGCLPFLPLWTRPLQPLVVSPVLRLTAIGGLPGAVRKRFAIPWRPDEEAEYRVLQLAVREGWRFVLPGLRYGPTAAAGRRTAAERRRTAAAERPRAAAS